PRAPRRRRPAPPAAAGARPPRPAVRAARVAAPAARPAAGAPPAARLRRNGCVAAAAAEPAASAMPQTRWAAAAGACPGGWAAAGPARPAQRGPPGTATTDSCVRAARARREQLAQRLQQGLIEDMHGMADPGLPETCMQRLLRRAEPRQEFRAQRARIARQGLAGFRIDEAA